MHVQFNIKMYFHEKTAHWSQKHEQTIHDLKMVQRFQKHIKQNHWLRTFS